MSEPVDLDAPLLGRMAHLQALTEGLRSAAGGRGALALVSGAAGLGKSAIVEAIQRRAESLGFSVCVGRAWEFADAPPWFPLRRCLRSLGIEVEALSDGEDAFALWERVLEALATTTAETPALWVIEDVHAADLQTLDLLNFLTQPIRGLRAFVVVTTRRDDPRVSERAQVRMNRMARDGIDVVLEPLSNELARQLVQRTLRRELNAVALEQLLELSAGNPLFLIEYARAFSNNGSPRANAPALPPSIKQIVLERVRWLPEATQATLELCSVLGRDVSAALLGRLLDALPARVIDELIPAMRAGVLEELSPGLFRFSHVLVRDAIYDELLPAKRAECHARAARAIASGASADATISAAQHALLGFPVSEPEVTLSLVDRAVEWLESQRAHDRAFALRKQADDARDHGFLPPATSQHLLDSARLARASGRHADAKSICERLLAQARAQGDAVLLAKSALALGAALRPGLVDPVLVGALEEASAALAPEEAALGCLTRARLAAALQPASDPQMPIRMAREAMAAARALQKPELLREVVYYAGSALVDFAPADERLACATELLLLSEQSGDRDRALHATVRLALEHATMGDFDAFSNCVDRALAFSDELGRAPQKRWRPLLLSSMRASARGDFAEAERAIVEVSQFASHSDDPALNLSLPLHQFMTLKLQRKDLEVATLLPKLQSMMPGAPLAEPMAALIRLSVAADIEDADAARKALALVEPYIEKFQADPDFCALVAGGVAFVGSNELRRRVRKLLEGGAPELSFGHIIMCYEGPTDRIIALLDAALGNVAGAERLLLKCLAAAEQRGHQTWVAVLQYDLGRVLAEAGEPVRARPYFELARLTASRVGIGALEQQALARLGGKREAVAMTSAPVSSAALELTRTGDSWLVGFAGRSLSARDTRGMRLLARLVERAGEEMHVLTLSGDSAGDVGESCAGEHLDKAARDAYRKRLAELEAELDQAESAADAARIERLGRERQMLVQELSRAVGLGGRARQAGSATERARINVRKRLKQAISSLAALDADLGRYLSQAIRTGAFCSFRP